MKVNRQKASTSLRTQLPMPKPSKLAAKTIAPEDDEPMEHAERAQILREGGWKHRKTPAGEFWYHPKTNQVATDSHEALRLHQAQRRPYEQKPKGK